MLFDRSQSSNFNNKLPLLCKLDISFDGKFLFLYRDSWEARDPGGGTPLQEPNGDVPLDGVAFSRLE